MILLWGLAQDANLRAVRKWLDRWGAETFFLNHADIYSTEVVMTTEPDLSFELTCGQASCQLEEVSAAYLRPYDYRGYPPSEFQQIHPCDPAMVHHLIAAWAEYTLSPVISRPSATAATQSYLYYAATIRASGFLAPEFQVTNVPDGAAEFRSRHEKTTANTLDNDRNQLTKNNFDGPIVLKEDVGAVTLRVHVVGGECFAPIKLPPSVERQAVTLTKLMGLYLAGLTLIPKVGGPWHCTGISANPAFASYPYADYVAQALARFLMAAPRPAMTGKKTARPPLNGVGPMGRNYAVLREETV